MRTFDTRFDHPDEAIRRIHRAAANAPKNQPRSKRGQDNKPPPLSPGKSPLARYMRTGEKRGRDGGETDE